ncbi:MAG: response regulator transcription factor [Desulfovibrio sp.]|nr:response regulator transcription factor [Desulfovibrio sp.]
MRFDIIGDEYRILLVDDHKLIMEGIRSLLAPYAHLRVVGMAQHGGDAVALAASLNPELLILDLHMPVMNGIDVGYAVREILPHVRILIYTGHEDQRCLPELIELGITGHVRKSEEPGVLLRGIEEVRQGRPFLTFPDPRGRMAKLLQQSLVHEDSFHDLNTLSPREKEIFRLLADGKSIRSIADTLFISRKTVETHKYNLLTKLRLESVGDLIKLAIRYGLVKV